MVDLYNSCKVQNNIKLEVYKDSDTCVEEEIRLLASLVQDLKTFH